MSLAPTKDGTSTHVIRVMSLLTDATQIAGLLAEKANSVCSTVTEVSNKSHKTLMELTKEAASIAQSEVSEFRDAMRETQACGEGLKHRCLELRNQWNSFENSIRALLDGDVKIEKDKVLQCLMLLQTMLDCAAKCGSCYQEFREKLNHAITVGSQLEQRCRVAAEAVKSEASNEKFVGYGTAGVLGTAALGFLTFATGGLALVGVAAAGAAAVGTGAYTYDRAGKLEKLATEFDGLRGQLGDALRELNGLGDSITGLYAITEAMVENMEIALKFVKQHERVRQENEAMMLENKKVVRRNEELEKVVRRNEELEKVVRRNEELEKRIEELEVGKRSKSKKKSKSKGSRRNKCCTM